MERKKQINKKPNKLEGKLTQIKKTALGIFLFGVLALTVTACGPQELPYYPEVNTQPTPTLKTEFEYLNSIDERQFVVNPVSVNISKSTPLLIEKVNGVITSIADPPLPCGEPSTYAPAEDPPTILYRNEREQLCFTIRDIAKSLGIGINQEQIETIASQMIIVSREDTDLICGKNKAGCYLSIPKKIILDYTDEQTVIHEKTHAKILTDDKYLDITDNACFMYDYTRGGFTMVFEDNNSSTGWSITHISQELLPSIFEQLMIKKRQEHGNYSKEYPRYTLESNLDEDKKQKLREMFDALDFSQSDVSFIFAESPISMSELFEFFETIAGPPKYIAEFTTLFSENMASQDLEPFINIVNSEISPIEACR